MPQIPALSVVLPIYNAAETLPLALKSVLRQTFSDFEVVAVDDGSEDGSDEILRDFADTDERVKPILRPHRGLIPALNEGFACAQGPFIARMDADDMSHPKRLELQYEFLRSNPEVSVVSCLVQSFPSQCVREGFRIYEAWFNGLITHEDMVREIFIESPLPHPSVVVKREEIMALGGYQDRGRLRSLIP